MLFARPQTSILTDGFRSLREGEPVEFIAEQGNDGRLRAVDVTGPGGANPQVWHQPAELALKIGWLSRPCIQRSLQRRLVPWHTTGRVFDHGSRLRAAVLYGAVY